MILYKIFHSIVSLDSRVISHIDFYSSGFLRRPQKFDEISQLILSLLSKIPIKWIVAFLENPNFKSELSGRSLSNNHLLKAESMKFGLLLMALLAKDISGL